MLFFTLAYDSLLYSYLRVFLKRDLLKLESSLQSDISRFLLGVLKLSSFAALYLIIGTGEFGCYGAFLIKLFLDLKISLRTGKLFL